MKAKIEVLNKRFEVKARNLGVDYPDWDKEKNEHYKYSIQVKSLDNGKRIRFNFWSSYQDFLDRKDKLTKEDLIFCFRCLLEDAILYLNSNGDIDEFASELGLTKPSEVLRAFKGCKKQYEKCLKLGLTDNEIFDMVNAIIDKENEDKLLDLVVE